MGEKITTREAAALANVSNRTIFKWLNQQKLTRYHGDNRTLIDKSELEAYVDYNESRVPPPSNLWSVIMRKMEMLEKRVEVLMILQDLQPPEDLTDERISLAYDQAQILLSKTKLPPHECEEAYRILFAITETALESLILTRGLPQPWLPFYELSKLLMRSLREGGKFKTDFAVQDLYLRTEKLRERIRDMALIFIEADPDSASREVFQQAVGVQSSIETELLRGLKSRYGRSGKAKKAKIKRDHEEAKEIARFLEGKDSSIRTSWGAVEALRALADKIEKDSKM